MPTKEVVLEPVEQKLVTLTASGADQDEVLAARLNTAQIYLPVKPLCTALGVNWPSQRQKIMADEVLAESTRTLRLKTRGGPQNLVCMDVEAIPMWLAGIEPSRVRADLRDRLITYKRWVRKTVYDAFARETGIETALSASQTMTPTNPDVTALIHIAQMAEAIATMARQQAAFEQQVESRFVTLQASLQGQIVEQHEEVMGRLDQAAVVVGSLLQRMNAVESMVAPGQVISEAQGAEISTLVKAIATEMAARDQVAHTTGHNPYQAVFGELYRRFRVSSYHNIPFRRFGEVIAWLREYQETLDAHGDDA
jgi:ferritin-like metal-binding protein YciE